MLVTLGLILTACGNPSGAQIEITAGDQGVTTPETATEITWTQAPLPEDFDVHTITAAGGLFVGLSWDEIEEPTPRTRLWLSEDGLEWEPVDVDAALFGMRAGYFQEVTAVDGTLIGIVKGELLTEGYADVRLVGSDDGRRWYPITIGLDAIPMGLSAGQDGAIVLTGTHDGEYRYQVWHSADGTDWEMAVSEAFAGMSPYKPTAAVGDNFYIVSHVDGESTALLSSSDGSIWSAADLPPLGSDWSGWMLPVNGPQGLLLFTGGVGSPRLWLVSEGTWLDVTPEGFEASWLPAGFSDPVVASSDGGPVMIIEQALNRPSEQDQTVIWWSIDGAAWEPLPGFAAMGVVEVAARGERVVIVDYAANGDGTLWIGDITH